MEWIFLAGSCHDCEFISLTVGQGADQRLGIACTLIVLASCIWLYEFDTSWSFEGRRSVLDKESGTFLKSAMWEAYWEGVLLRLGASLESGLGSLQCSSFMIYYYRIIERTVDSK